METMQQRYRKIVLIRIAVVMLLASLAGFSTLAKNVQYLPKSNPARYLSIASKMKADCAPVTVEAPPVEPRTTVRAIASAIPPKPIAFSCLLEQRTTQVVAQVRIYGSVQRRGPPVSLS
jgi:hypothetical protein